MLNQRGVLFGVFLGLGLLNGLAIALGQADEGMAIGHLAGSGGVLAALIILALAIAGHAGDFHAGQAGDRLTRHGGAGHGLPRHRLAGHGLTRLHAGLGHLHGRLRLGQRLLRLLGALLSAGLVLGGGLGGGLRQRL